LSGSKPHDDRGAIATYSRADALMHTHYREIDAYETMDSSLIRETIHPAGHGNQPVKTITRMPWIQPLGSQLVTIMP
jgi:hypothetical protein